MHTKKIARRALGAGGVARRDSVCPGASAGLHYQLEQISKSEVLRKLKKRFGGKTIRDVRFRVG
jgi:hypothetical protein